MISRVPVIAGYTVLEALRTRLLQIAAVVVLLVLGASYFVHEVALIENARMQTVAYAAITRLAAVFVLALHVIASVAREFNDKGLDAVLALDIPRWQYIVGKYAGLMVLAALIAVVCALPLLAHAAPLAVLAWLFSLMLELCIIAALALFCVVTFSHLVPAAAFVTGFYMLCRAVTGLRLISEHPTAGAESLLHQFLGGALTLVSVLIPPFDQWTRTAWLVTSPPSWNDLGPIGLEAVIYTALLLSATLVDFYRKNL
ncbi:MAG TPA: ABC transporter permease [Burkholderiales bacterium]|jgi:hypothetical protein